jgi:hypothetical protein
LEAVRSGHLSYTHLLIAQPLPVGNGDYVQALRDANDENWGKRRFAEEVAHRRGIVVNGGEGVNHVTDTEAVEEFGQPETIHYVWRVCPTCDGEGSICEEKDQ